ncbi:MAG: hypothetical protein ACJ8IK_05045 [Burkholderiaceae bacterium]
MPLVGDRGPPGPRGTIIVDSSGDVGSRALAMRILMVLAATHAGVAAPQPLADGPSIDAQAGLACPGRTRRLIGRARQQVGVPAS